MPHRVSLMVALACGFASTASAQAFRVDSTSSSTTSSAINVVDDALTVKFEVLEADDNGALQIMGAYDQPDTQFDVTQIHCMAREYEALVHAVADRTVLDAMLELGHGKLTIAVLDARTSWTATTKFVWQHLPAERDSRFVYGVKVDVDEVVVTAMLGGESCYAASASQLAQGLRQLLRQSRDDAPAEIRRLNDALTSRARARAKTK